MPQSSTLPSHNLAGGEKGMSDSQEHLTQSTSTSEHDQTRTNELAQPIETQVAEEKNPLDTREPEEEMYATPPPDHIVADGKWFADPVGNHKPLDTPDEEAHLRHKSVPTIDFDDPDNDTDIISPYDTEFDPQEETDRAQRALHTAEQIESATFDIQSNPHATIPHENTPKASHELTEEEAAANRNELSHGLRHERPPILDDHPPHDVINSLKQEDPKVEEESNPLPNPHLTEDHQSDLPDLVPDINTPSDGNIHQSESIDDQFDSIHHEEQATTDSNHQTSDDHDHLNHGENHDHDHHHHGDVSHESYMDYHDQENQPNHDDKHDHDHGDHHHHGHDDHHHGHDHHHGDSHGQMGMDFSGGNDYGMGGHMGGGHQHGAPKESRDLSSMGSTSEFVDPDLEGFDLFLAYVEEYWRIAKVTSMDFYDGVIVPTLRENSSWYSGLAILAPVFLLFLLALRRHPDPFVPFQEPLYRTSNKKGTSSTPFDHAGGSSTTSRNTSSSDQSFAPSPGFVKGSPTGNHPSQPAPLGAHPSGGKDQKNRAVSRKPNASSAPSNPLPSMVAPSHTSPKHTITSTPTKTPILAPVNPGPPTSSKEVNHPSSSHFTAISAPKQEFKVQKSPMKEASSLASSSTSESSSSSSSESPSPVINSGAPLPMPSLKGPKQAVIAPRPRRAIPVPGAAKK